MTYQDIENRFRKIVFNGDDKQFPNPVKKTGPQYNYAAYDVPYIGTGNNLQMFIDKTLGATKIYNYVFSNDSTINSISSADQLKDLFIAFSYTFKNTLEDGEELYYFIEENNQPIKVNYDRWFQFKEYNQNTAPYKKLTYQKFDQQKIYTKLIQPLLNNYYISFTKSQEDILLKKSVDNWWKQTTNEGIIKNIVAFSKLMTTGLNLWTSSVKSSIEIDLTGTEDLKVDVDTFFNALFNGSYVKGAKHNVLEALGYSEWVVKQTGINSWNPFSGSVAEATIENQANLQASGSQLSSEIFEKTLNLPPLNEEGKINLKQCALITGLLHNDNININGHVDFRNYISDLYYDSPLWPKRDFDLITGKPTLAQNLKNRLRRRSRIYPVSPNISNLDPNQFVNLCTIDPAIKPTLETNNQIDPNSMYKFLFWVYKGTNGLREVKIPLTSQNANEEDRAQYRKLRQAQNLKNNNTLAPEELESQIQSIVPGVKQEQIEDKITELGAKLKKKNKADDLFYFLKETNIKFEGTNPSTARNDVQVTLTFELSSISALDSTIVTLSGEKDGLPHDKTIEIRIMDLVTITSTNKTSTKDGDNNNLMSNAYSPDYSRLRLKISPNTLDQNVLVIDIATIDHQISRDSTTGKTTLTINYRGYFETVMSMPFNDALADHETMENRWNRQKQGLNVLKQQNCKPSTIREAMRIETENLAREGRKAGFSSILKRLMLKGSLHSFSLDPLYSGSRIGNVLDPRKNYVKRTKPGRDQGSTNEEFSKNLDRYQDRVQKDKQKDADKQSTALQLDDDKFFGDDKSGHFFFLGDLMHVVSDCLYKEKDGKASHNEWVRDMNMRFIISTINIPNPKDLDGAPLKINPICIPIDVHFFVQWFSSVVVNKNLSYYPVGVFMRDLIERLVNNIIQETCFSLLLPDQTAAQLRVGFFTDESSDWFINGEDGWFNPKDPFLDRKSSDDKIRPLFKRSLSSEISNNSISTPIKSKNYCVIYQQFSSFLSQLNSSRAGRLKDDPYTISLYYGIKNNQHNFLSNVSFSKTNSPYLREARYFSNSYGSLSLLSNVYDLSFSFVRRKANTFFLPGNIINFYLLDWGKTWGKNSPPWSAKDDKEFGQANPHDDGTISNILGMGGYFTILSVEYVLGETPGEFEIKISTKFSGTDAVKHPANVPNETNKIEDSKACADAFNVIAERAEELYEKGDELFEKASESYAINASANVISLPTFGSTALPTTTGASEPNETKASEAPLDLFGNVSGSNVYSLSSYTNPGRSTDQTQQGDFLSNALQQQQQSLEQKLSEIYTGWVKSSADKISGKKLISELTNDNPGFFKAIVDAVVASGLHGEAYMEDNSYYYHVFADGTKSIIKIYNR